MIRILRTTLLLLALLITTVAQATHNRAGEITYVQTGDLSVIATITTYTKGSSIPADRDSLELCWGDGTCEWVPRNNGPNNEGILLGNDIKLNTYVASHTYPGLGHYQMSMTDPNRNGGVLNVNPPSSDTVPFHIQTSVTFFNPQFAGYNNSPILLQPPVDIGCVGQPFIHNPNAYDIDGDSLSYELIVPLQAPNTQVPNYSFPNSISPNPLNNVHSLNSVTGDFTWVSPQVPGEYNIAMYIIEWRNGVPIDTLIRDMQIFVESCENEPPVIETEEEICVIAGELIEFDVIATDPDIPLQQVKLTALGGPFVVDISPAEFVPDSGFYQDQPVVRTFRWQTKCEHISDQFYSVVFKAVDDWKDTTGLATLKTVTIKVVGPPPEDLQALPDDDNIELSWESPYSCEVTENDYFKGFSVWRRLGSNQFPPDTCIPGLEGRGYTKIEDKIFDLNSNDRFFYIDTDVERGRNYCYRILADFAKTSAGGYNFNEVESLPSEEICVQLNRDIPLITHVDVRTTDATNGEILVQWSTPKADDLDTILNHGPYTFELYQATGMTTTGLTLIPAATKTFDNFWEINDTSHLDMGLNTVDNSYSYQLSFYVKGETEPLGSSVVATSTYLNIASTDRKNVLTWDLDVPWENFEYAIVRQNTFNPVVWDTIGFSNIEEYTDENLLNGREYCYKVEGRGSYNINGIASPLLNNSQENCGTPLDTVPPCPPELSISNDCDNADILTPEESFENDLTWINPIHLCEETDDVVSYNIYYAPPSDPNNFQLIGSNGTPNDTTYTHQPEFGIAGCYAVTAIDSFSNESLYSNIICVDNCPSYTLPNAFTPNSDGANDLFIPYPYRFIDRVEMNIFNLWGELVFTTNDPALNWNGTNLSGKDLAEGTYFYTCKVFEERVEGVVENPDILSGYIKLIRGN